MTQRISMLVAGLLLAGGAWAGQERQVSLQWNELSSQVEGRKVAMVLPGGASIEGTVRGVEPDGLSLDIFKTSDKRVQPKGLHVIPRQSVSVLRITEYRKLGRALVTTGMFAAGATIAALGVSGSGVSEGVMVVALPAAGAAGTLGLGAAGYYIGKSIDKRVTIIRVVPGN